MKTKISMQRLEPVQHDYLLHEKTVPTQLGQDATEY